MKKKSIGFLLFSIFIFLLSLTLIGAGVFFLFFAPKPSLKASSKVEAEEEIEDGNSFLLGKKDDLEFKNYDFEFRFNQKMRESLSSSIKKEEKDTTEDAHETTEESSDSNEDDSEQESSDSRSEEEENQQDDEEESDSENDEDSSEETAVEFLCPYISDRLLDEDDIQSLQEQYEKNSNPLLPTHKSAIQMVINELYAKRGYKFKDKKIQAYFNQFEWYKKIKKKSRNMDKIRERIDKNEIEKKNHNFLGKYRDGH